ncbi:hypothetical protein MKW92_011546 [Papaver armeniacum]|nr:hypothetical protein MKW92_023955 [Papaver armeniacum]KAI3930309.1 hypothetical protein MKW92_023960 [Papaver armeniacum]KAI3947198.1 hypothetical protein MKW92_011546 [Papaver armeniacum]
MEGKNVKVISLMVIVMFGMFVGRSSAFSKDCFVGCMVACAVTHPNKSMFVCPFTCLKKCIFRSDDPDPSNKIESPGDRYCKLGCATANCISKSTPQNPRGDQVEHCVNSYCAKKCTN